MPEESGSAENRGEDQEVNPEVSLEAGLEGDPDNRVFGAREQLAIWLLLASAFVVILNETIMSVALPKLMEDLSITAAAAQWLTTAFLLTMSVVIPITGMLIRSISTRVLFISAMSLFTVGTMVCAVAPGLPLLLVGRVVQASGTAIMMPLLMTTVTNLVPPHSRGRLMGRIAIVMSVAPALGPTISGLILQSFGWRWMFIFVLPIALVALLLGALRLPNVGELLHSRIDAFSVLLSALGFGGLVYGLSLVGEQANGDATISPLIPVAIGVVSLIVFVRRQVQLQTEDRALLDLRTLKSKPFTLSVILLGLSMVALFGSIILLPIYVQSVLGFSTLDSGLVLLPGGLLMGLLGPTVGRLVDARGARFMLVPGVTLTAISLWSFTLLTDSSSIWQVLVSHMVLSLGLAATFTPLFSVSLGSLPQRLTAYGSALIGTVQQVAGAAGTALFITVMTLVSTAIAVSPDAVDPHSLAAGTRAAFIVGAIAATVCIVIACFVTEDKVDAVDREPEPEPTADVSS